MALSLESRLYTVAAPIPKAEGEDAFDGLTDRSMSEERPTSSIRLT